MEAIQDDDSDLSCPNFIRALVLIHLVNLHFVTFFLYFAFYSYFNLFILIF